MCILHFYDIQDFLTLQYFNQDFLFMTVINFFFCCWCGLLTLHGSHPCLKIVGMGDIFVTSPERDVTPQNIMHKV